MSTPSANHVSKSSAKAVNIESMLKEKRIFKPSAKFAKKARIGSLQEIPEMHRASLKNPDKFWGKAAQELDWFRQWKKVACGSRPSRSGLSAASSTRA